MGGFVESLYCAPETIITLDVNYTVIKIKKSKKKKKKEIVLIFPPTLRFSANPIICPGDTSFSTKHFALVFRRNLCDLSFNCSSVSQRPLMTHRKELVR